MYMNEAQQKTQLTVPDSVLSKWQSIVDLMASLIGVPAGLIMRITELDTEVLVSSRSPGNPYRPGDKEHLPDSGLYCETVFKTNLLVPNALSDDNWKDNPDIKLNMISYLGFPILLPDGQLFGTICVLDTKENHYSQPYKQLISHLRDIIQGHLELLFMNYLLGEDNKQLRDYVAEIQTLRAILPICSYCKKIRDDDGYWQAVDHYISEHRETKFSHSLCPDCARKLYPPELIEGLFHVKAVLRPKEYEEIEDTRVLKIHNLVIDSGRHEVLVNGESKALNPTEFKILYILARRPGWVFARDQIISAIRGDDYPVTHRSVDVQLVGLRKKLGESGACIETIRGVGYRFRE
jgi:hypothetical protein